jgi:hypothetical protein
VSFADSTPANTLVTTSGGNVGIGTSSPGAKLDITGASGEQRIIVRAAASTSATLDLAGNGNAAGSTSFTIRQDTSGQALLFNRANTPMIFATNEIERARIDSSGNLLVGTTSTIGSARIGVLFNGQVGNGIGLQTTFASPGTDFIRFVNSAGSAIGNITQNATNTVQYATSSDYRLKHDIQPMTGALAKVAALKPVTYKWNADDSQSQGFIAHELQEVVPECVTGEKDAVDAEGKPQYQGIDTSFLVATLTAAIQEQQAIISAQQTALTALTARVEAQEVRLTSLEGAQA